MNVQKLLVPALATIVAGLVLIICLVASADDAVQRSKQLYPPMPWEKHIPTLGENVLTTVGFPIGAFVVICGYLLPAMIGGFRGHSQYWFLFCINLCIGWTGLVWLVCLFWAAMWRPHAQSVVQHFHVTPTINPTETKPQS